MSILYDTIICCLMFDEQINAYLVRCQIELKSILFNETKFDKQYHCAFFETGLKYITDSVCCFKLEKENWLLN